MSEKYFLITKDELLDLCSPNLPEDRIKIAIGIFARPSIEKNIFDCISDILKGLFEYIEKV